MKRWASLLLLLMFLIPNSGLCAGFAVSGAEIARPHDGFMGPHLCYMTPDRPKLGKILDYDRDSDVYTIKIVRKIKQKFLKLKSKWIAGSLTESERRRYLILSAYKSLNRDCLKLAKGELNRY